jgi:Flp pilus assembly pilin Flp
VRQGAPFWLGDTGAGIVEVALLIAIIAVTAMAALKGTGEKTKSTFGFASTTLAEAHGSILGNPDDAGHCPTWPDC